jgi:EAL domain-containing protein (putative c-di-GMP-specific phosphodiesterase class I)
MPKVPERLCDATVLIVDDLQANLDVLELLLGMAGLRSIVTERSAVRTLERYRSTRPDLILLDWHMPDMDGHAVLAELRREIGPDDYIPIVVVTADVTSGARDDALLAGATDFLTKPIDRVEAILRVRNLLETRALHRRLADHNTELEAQLAAQAVAEREAATRHLDAVDRIGAVLSDRSITMLYQPVVDLGTGMVVGAEALARFRGGNGRAPDKWFAEAHAVGLGTELELLAVELAVSQIDRLPSDAYLSLNVSATTASDPALAAILAVTPGSRIVVELTEHTRVVDYDAVVEDLDRLRYQGIRVAVDDAGAGYAGLQHILRLQPDIIKLDRDLTTGIDRDPARRALASSQVVFGREVGAIITAEGIETAGEYETLRSLGVPWGQGYFLAVPADLPLPQPPLPPVPVPPLPSRGRQRPPA